MKLSSATLLASTVLLLSTSRAAPAWSQEGEADVREPETAQVEAEPVSAGSDATARPLPERLAAKLAKEERKRAQGLKPFDKPREALEFFLRKRLAPGQRTLPVERYLAAREHMKAMQRYSTALGRELSALEARSIESAIMAEGAPLPALGTWQPLGPGNVGGRTRGLVIHPGTPATMYAAGVAGGVWKTTNGGTSWTPIGDLLANIAVSSLVMDPADPDVLYAGTGEGYFNLDAVRGAGIFKTTDGGLNWTHLAITVSNADFFFVNDLVVSPTDSNRIYAATRTGVWRSLDGGATWSKRLTPAPTGDGCLDLAIRTDTPGADTIFAGCGNHSSDGIYRSTDSGGSFPAVLTAAAVPNIGRVSLAIVPSNQNVVYALVANNAAAGYTVLNVYRTTTGGAAGSWSPRLNTAVKLNNQLLNNTVFGHFSDCGFGADAALTQGWYDNVIAVDPANSDVVWAGGIDLFRSDDGGANWGMGSHWWASAGNSHLAHADQHVIAFHPAYNGTSNQQMFVGNDGGVFRTLNARAATAVGNTAPCNADVNGSVAWTDLNNGYAVTQFYYGVPYPDGSQFFGGTQDNGTVRGNLAGGADAWSTLLGGDGGAVAVNPANVNRLYAENFGLSIQRSDNGGGSWVAATTGITESSNNFLFITPFVLDPNNPNNLWTGGFFLWRTTNATTSWVQASAVTPGNGAVSALAVAKGNSNVAAFGMDDGWIGRTTTALTNTGATNWPSVQPRAGYVSSLAFDPSNPNVFYATYSTFGGGHVWKSVNGGASFTDVSGSGATGLPDIPVHSIVVDPSDPATLYVGTDLGVFVSRDQGNTWFVEQTGFANVVTEDLTAHTIGSSGFVYAFTHGRGAWRVPTSTATGGFAAPTITAPAPSSTIGVRGITFSWTPVGGAVNVYDLLVLDTQTGAVVFSGSLSGAAANSALVTLESGTYLFKVRGCANVVSNATCGSFNTRTFTVDLVEPVAAPAITAPGVAQVFTSSTQTLAWSAVAAAPGGGEVRYEVLLEDMAGGTTDLQIATAGLSTIFSMHSSTQYRLRVRACQQACGPYSAARTFVVALPPVPVLAPVLTTSTVTGNQLDLAWSAVPNADLYQVQVIQPTGGPGGGALTVAARQVSTTFLNDLPLPQGAANVIVSACNGDGCGPFSAPAGINVSGPNPSTPNVATPIAGTVTAGPVISLAWNRIPGDNGSNTVYRLFVQDLSRQAPALDVFTTQSFWSAFLKAEGGRYDAVVLAPGNVAGSVSGFNVAGVSAVAPTMTTPAHQSQLTAGNLDLAWSPVPLATLYEYFVAVQGQPDATVRGVTQGLSVKVPLGVVSGPSTTYSAIARACPAGATCAPGGSTGWGPWSNEPGGPGVTNFTVVP